MGGFRLVGTKVIHAGSFRVLLAVEQGNRRRPASFAASRLHAGSDAFNVSAVIPVRSQTLPKQEPQTELALGGSWRVVVLNDPVNLMSYVVLVFKKVFGFDEQRARKHMLEVHEQGRSVVWSGLREKAEAYVFTLHQWHLSAVLEPDETH